MVKKRLVACLLWRDGGIVQSVNFSHTNMVGSASTAVEFFNMWGIDEIVLLDVSRDTDSRDKFYETVRRLSKQCFVPLTVGGWVKTTDEMRRLLQIGADKIAINTEAKRNPELIESGSNLFGGQCIVVSVDARRTDTGHEVVIDRGKEPTQTTPSDWAAEAESRGAGEIFLTSIDQDGTKEGYEIDLIRSVSDVVNVPVVASGGAGDWEHLVTAIRDGRADAVSVANRFHHSQHSTTKAKEHMIDAGLSVRKPAFAERYQV